MPGNALDEILCKAQNSSSVGQPEVPVYLHSAVFKACITKIPDSYAHYHFIPSRIHARYQ